MASLSKMCVCVCRVPLALSVCFVLAGLELPGESSVSTSPLAVVALGITDPYHHIWALWVLGIELRSTGLFSE